MHKMTQMRLKRMRDVIDIQLELPEHGSINDTLTELDTGITLIRMDEWEKDLKDTIELNLAKVQQGWKDLVNQRVAPRDQGDMIDQIFMSIKIHLYDERDY